MIWKEEINIWRKHKDQMIAEPETHRKRESKADTCLEEGSQHAEGSQPVAVADSLVVGSLVVGRQPVGDAGDNQLR